MKILVDPVYTQRVRICSGSYLAWQIVEEMSKRREDVFFYMILPEEKMEQADWDWINSRPYRDRVTLLDMYTNPVDRLSELYMLRDGLHKILHPLNRNTWDIDIVVSGRIPVLKHMMIHSSRPGGKLRSARAFFGTDNMPCLPGRDTVPWHEHAYADTIMSYAMSDGILISGMWMKKLIAHTAREVLSPAWQKRALANVYGANLIKLERLKMGRDYVPGKDFNIGFTGRITGTRNFEGVAELFRKQFSFPLGPNKACLKFSISTNSQCVGAADAGEIDFIDYQMNDRAAFYTFLETQHLVVNLSSTEDFSITTHETLRHGVPMIVYDRPWTEFLGPDYPFRVKGETEAYALINAFVADYPKMYKLFSDWESTWWKNYVESPETNVTTSEKLIQLINDFEIKRAEAFLKQGAMARERLQSIAETELDLTEIAFESIPKGDRVTSLALGRVPNTLVWKVIAYELGYTDTAKTGIMVRKT
jgi:hypothetical protein